MSKVIGISLDDDQLALLRSVKGCGTKDAEILRNIIVAYLAENGHLDKLQQGESQ